VVIIGSSGADAASNRADVVLERRSEASSVKGQGVGSSARSGTGSNQASTTNGANGGAAAPGRSGAAGRAGASAAGASAGAPGALVFSMARRPPRSPTCTTLSAGAPLVRAWAASDADGGAADLSARFGSWFGGPAPAGAAWGRPTVGESAGSEACIGFNDGTVPAVPLALA
jgi:hypothetical protein